MPSGQTAGLRLPAGGIGWNRSLARALSNRNNAQTEAFMGRGILLWLLGIPIPIIILILLFWR
ncbi:hypothetical protein [Mesorhizobium sp. 8]|uniref:hypothetical protein n=1 Tax=Mesorhizobium sp. 8 TaxID=2584466 RepID=UPI00111E4192|nr:hypothetical protein [Mesorhizobium sp. 8]QDC02072.1 hypothetical protein FGU64_17450 [Mesorhizobium sp. 8]